VIFCCTFLVHLAIFDEKEEEDEVEDLDLLFNVDDAAVDRLADDADSSLEWLLDWL